MSKKYRVTVSHLPLGTVQHVANELHQAVGTPNYEGCDTFGVYPAMASFEIMYSLTEEQRKKIVKYFNANFLMGEIEEEKG